ncbi:MAG: hypothetical protein HC906_03640 [Bacteroidales bacterium]|nr:hypothetical protein [Bacteroidales bacterium]
MNIDRKNLHRRIYFIGLVLLVVSLPFSLFLLSLSMFILGLNWIAEGNLKNKALLIYSRKSILFLVSIYLVHLLGLIFTTNFEYARHDLKIKLPLLILPVIIGTSDELKLTEIKTLFHFFVAAVTTSTLISFVVYLNQHPLQIIDQRDISLFYIAYPVFITCCNEHFYNALYGAIPVF